LCEDVKGIGSMPERGEWCGTGTMENTINKARNHNQIDSFDDLHKVLVIEFQKLEGVNQDKTKRNMKGYGWIRRRRNLKNGEKTKASSCKSQQNGNWTCSMLK